MVDPDFLNFLGDVRDGGAVFGGFVPKLAF